MPIYEYQCSKCGHRFEVLQKVGEAPLAKCQRCKGRVERIVSSPAIQFKGSGWYVTDYARKGSTSDTPKSETPAESSTTETTTSKKAKEKTGSKAK